MLFKAVESRRVLLVAQKGSYWGIKSFKIYVECFEVP